MTSLGYHYQLNDLEDHPEEPHEEDQENDIFDDNDQKPKEGGDDTKSPLKEESREEISDKESEGKESEDEESKDEESKDEESEDEESEESNDSIDKKITNYKYICSIL